MNSNKKNERSKFNRYDKISHTHPVTSPTTSITLVRKNQITFHRLGTFNNQIRVRNKHLSILFQILLLQTKTRKNQIRLSKTLVNHKTNKKINKKRSQEKIIKSTECENRFGE
jgi:hypothetical protein